MTRVSHLGQLVRDILGKIAKNCMTVTKPTFLGQNREAGQANFSGSGGEILPPQSPPLGEALMTHV